MGGEGTLVPIERIERSILTIRGQRVMLDADLAELYGVATKVLNQAVKRNPQRFPEDFVFHLSLDEKMEVVTNCDHLARLKFSPTLPFAFTEHGAIMAANVLNSGRAAQVSVLVVRAFVRLRQAFAAHKELAQKLAELERKVVTHDTAIREIVEAIKQLAALPSPEPEKSKIGFGVKEASAPYHRRRRRVR